MSYSILTKARDKKKKKRVESVRDTVSRALSTSARWSETRTNAFLPFFHHPIQCRLTEDFGVPSKPTEKLITERPCRTEILTHNIILKDTTPIRQKPYRVPEKMLERSPTGLYLYTGCEQYAAAYLDDVVIYSGSWQEHLQHLADILKRLQEAGLTINTIMGSDGRELPSRRGPQTGSRLYVTLKGRSWPIKDV
ncbi:uncharacterized protein LOC131532954 isoform X2 [Onychostoma macrolepis]|uniref:uncharacterized protein LOC131532954 isoform X2 n=1 Tax=Onychostoma macrolepis TaxID=369639 RepID=UPI00272C3A0D|nr:uncharacterized protein LOC131532954 isoform X2 [Onychostoma macrolepis]